MQKNSSNFTPDEARRLAETPAGQQLMAALQHADDGMLQQAAQQMMDGNTEEAKKLLLPLLRDPKIAALLRQLGG